MKSWILSTLHCVVVSFVLYALGIGVTYILQGALIGRPELLKLTATGGSVWLCTFEDELADTHEKIMETREALGANERLGSPKMFFVSLPQAAAMAQALANEFKFTNLYPSPLCIRAAVLLTVLREMSSNDALILVRSRLTVKKDLNLLVTENLTTTGSIALFKDPVTNKFQTDFIIATKSELTLRVARDFFSALVHANVTAATSTQADTIFNLFVSDMAAFSQLQVKHTVANASCDEGDQGALGRLEVEASIEANHEQADRTRASVVSLPSKMSQFVSDSRDKNGLSFVWVSFKEWAKARLFGNVCPI